MSKKFFQKYFKDQTNLLAFDEKTLSKLYNVKKFLALVKRRKKKVIIFLILGNASVNFMQI